MRGRLHPGSGKLSVESLEFREMTMEDIFLHTFKAMNSELGISQHADNQPLWQRRLSTASVFCQALVANNYLTTEQMQRAAQRYRLGASRDGGVIFWQIDATATTTAVRRGSATCCASTANCRRSGSRSIVCLACTC